MLGLRKYSCEFGGKLGNSLFWVNGNSPITPISRDRMLVGLRESRKFTFSNAFMTLERYRYCYGSKIAAISEPYPARVWLFKEEKARK